MTRAAALTSTRAVTALSEPAAEAAIHAACRVLALPTVRDETAAIAEAAARERLTHKAFLAEVLSAECDDRDTRRRIRRVNEAKFPRAKRLASFDTTTLPDLPPASLAHLASGGWIDAGQPLVLLGDSGTGKTHCETSGWGPGGPDGAGVSVSVPVITTDPNESLTRLVGGVLAVDLSSWSPAPAWPTIVGLIRSSADPVGSCLITVLPRGDLTQAGADPVGHFTLEEAP